MAIKREPVVGSHNIRSVGHENGVMEIEFSDGKVYQYTGEMATHHYNEMMKAPSKGSYFHRNVRHCKKTTCTKLDLTPKTE